MAEILVSAAAKAPHQTVWDVLSDQAGMSAWAPLASVRLERQGDPAPNGVGAIRVLSLRPFAVREEIIGMDAPTSLRYRMLSGLPVSDYVGKTTLTDLDGSTGITWTITLTPRFPGVAFAVRLGIGRLVRGLVAEAERRARSSSAAPSNHETEG